MRILLPSQLVAYQGEINWVQLPKVAQNRANATEFFHAAVAGLGGTTAPASASSSSSSSSSSSTTTTTTTTSTSNLRIQCQLEQNPADDIPWNLILTLLHNSSKFNIDVPITEVCTQDCLSNLLASVNSAEHQLTDAMTEKTQLHKDNQILEKNYNDLSHQFKRKEAQLLASFLTILNRKKERIRELKDELVELETSMQHVSNNNNTRRNQNESENDYDTDEERDMKNRTKEMEEEEINAAKDSKSHHGGPEGSSSSSNRGFMTGNFTQPTGFTQLRTGNATLMGINAEDMLAGMTDSDEDEEQQEHQQQQDSRRPLPVQKSNVAPVRTTNSSKNNKNNKNNKNSKNSKKTKRKRLETFDTDSSDGSEDDDSDTHMKRSAPAKKNKSTGFLMKAGKRKKNMSIQKNNGSDSDSSDEDLFSTFCK